jgi:hypothetical protein
MTISSTISKEKGQFITGKGCGNPNNPIRYLDHVPENTKGFECSFIPKRTGFITFEPEDGMYINDLHVYKCKILTINFGKPNSTFHLLSKECPKSNLETTFINKKTAATPTFCKLNYRKTLHIGKKKCFWIKK